MHRAISSGCLAAIALTLLAGAIVSPPPVVTHESLFPDHAVKPAGLRIESRRRLGPPPPGHPRIVGELRPDDVVTAERPGHSFAWTFVGPSVIDSEYWSGNAKASGRVNGIAPHPTDPAACWISTDGGGVWRTLDDGASWKPLTDSLPTLRGGSLLVDPDDASTIYWGTGDFRIGSTGGGIFRSTDGGDTWSQFATASSVGSSVAGMARVAGSPGSMVVAGAVGIRRSTNGGASWSTLVSGSATSLWSDAAGSRLYAGVRSSGVYRSSNAGAAWTKCVSPDFPASGSFSVVTVGACKSAPDTVFAAFVNTASGGVTSVCRSVDGGLTWTRLSSANDFCRPQCWYDAYVAVDPIDPAVAYLGGVDRRYGVFGVARSTDGGDTWTDIANDGQTQLHPDHHTMTFGPSPTGGTRIWEGNDGGVWTSDDGGSSWANRNSDLATALLYNVAVHPLSPERMLGGSQDNGTPERLGDQVAWEQLQTGDGGYSAFVPDASGMRFTTYVYGRIYRWNSGNSATLLTPNWSDLVAWIAPILLDPTDPDRLYVGTNRVWVCTTASRAFPTTTAERTQIWSPLSATGTVANSNSVIQRMAIAETNPAIIYTGCSGGSVWRTLDRGATWARCGGPVFSGGVSGIAINPHDPQEVWVSHYASSGARVYRTLDGGTTWNAVGTRLPSGVTPRALGVHFHRAGDARRTVLVGSGAGIYHSLDLGTTWTPNDASIPNANIGDFHVDRRAGLVTVATYGRGAWRAALPVDCPSDLDGNGEIDLGDVALLMIDFGPCVGCASDLDGTGEIDLGDVVFIQMDFGPCQSSSVAPGA